jgi:hypothetical protein
MTPIAPPSDAIVLIGGNNLSKWGKGADAGKIFGVGPKTGELPSLPIRRARAGSGNSHVFPMSLYEIQALNAYHNPTYADGLRW